MSDAADGPMNMMPASMAARAASGQPRIGPNAIIQVMSALTDIVGNDTTRRIADRCGLLRHFNHPPDAMVDECEVIRLHRAVRDTLDDHAARAVFREAGLRTGDYILAHRIPGLVQALLRPLPAGLSATLLMPAIGRHAWTFAGSGAFSYHGGHPVQIRIAGCPICRGVRSRRPECAYYAATFERLFQTLVSHRANVTETACMATGGEACLFELRWRH